MKPTRDPNRTDTSARPQTAQERTQPEPGTREGARQGPGGPQQSQTDTGNPNTQERTQPPEPAERQRQPEPQKKEAGSTAMLLSYGIRVHASPSSSLLGSGQQDATIRAARRQISTVIAACARLSSVSALTRPRRLAVRRQMALKACAVEA